MSENSKPTRRKRTKGVTKEVAPSASEAVVNETPKQPKKDETKNTSGLVVVYH